MNINTIRNYIPSNKGKANAKDTFLFSFYAAGMLSSDILQLKWTNIVGDRIRFEPNRMADNTQIALLIKNKRSALIFNLFVLMSEVNVFIFI